MKAANGIAPEVDKRSGEGTVPVLSLLGRKRLDTQGQTPSYPEGTSYQLSPTGNAT